MVSEEVFAELSRAPEPRRSEVLGLFASIKPRLAPVTSAARSLAEAFVAARIVPAGKPEDAIHVAVAIAAGIPILASWNFKHIVGPARSQRFLAVAVLHGYAPTLSIVSPAELIYEP